MRLAAVVLLTLMLPASAAAAKPCALHAGDHVVTKTKAAIVVRHPNRHNESTYRGCLKSVGRWRTLLAGHFDGYGGEAADKAALGGRYAAVSVFSGDHYNTGTYSIRVVNLRTGHARRNLAVGHTDGDFGPHDYAVTALAVSRYGTLGWVAQENASSPYAAPAAPRSSITGHDSNGSRLLDSGDYDSIGAPEFRGATLHWTYDGEQREARLGRK
jgi:hypothetical protein